VLNAARIGDILAVHAIVRGLTGWNRRSGKPSRPRFSPSLSIRAAVDVQVQQGGAAERENERRAPQERQPGTSRAISDADLRAGMAGSGNRDSVPRNAFGAPTPAWRDKRQAIEIGRNGRGFPPPRSLSATAASTTPYSPAEARHPTDLVTEQSTPETCCCRWGSVG
jgi:hypothetical protein